MNQCKTIQAPAETEKTGANVPGTLGFDLYLMTLGLNREAFKAPRAVRVCFPQ